MIRIRFNGKRNAPRDLGFTVDEFLTRVAAVVRVSGEYVTKRQADERNEREGYPVDEPFYLSTAKSATRVNTATLNVTDADRAFAAEAYQHVAALPVEARAKSEFLSDLYAAVQNGVVNARTAGTIAFAVELLRRDRERAAKAETSATPCDASRIVTMLAGAREKGLKFPKIRLQVNGQQVCFSLAGDRAKQPGSINVTDGGSYGDNKWFGRITVDGTFTPSSSCRDDVKALVLAFAADPAKVAAEYGHLTGNCSFCQRALSDERSTEVGYGPVCADRFELPWGVKAPKAQVALPGIAA